MQHLYGLDMGNLVYIVIQDSNDYVLDSGVSFNKRSPLSTKVENFCRNS